MVRRRDGLGVVKKAYEQLGRNDPLYGVLSLRQFRGNRWDREEFFRSGEEHIRQVFSYLGDIGVEVGTRRALDFGCGVGRLSQPLSDRFDEVLAVDISSTMLDAAKRFNTKGDRIRFLLNDTDKLQAVPSGSVDFVFTTLTLQHIPMRHQVNYILEFMRVLRPGGVAVFSVVNARSFDLDSFRGRLFQVRRLVRRAWRRVTRRPAVEIHYIARAQVEKAVADGGCEVRDVVDASSARKQPADKFRYCAVKPVT